MSKVPPNVHPFARPDHRDAELERLASASCRALREASCFDAASIWLTGADDSGLVLLGSDGHDERSGVDLRTVRTLAERADVRGDLVEAGAGRFVGLPVEIASTAALIVADRGPDPWPYDGCPIPVFLGAARVAVLALESHVRSRDETERQIQRARTALAREIHEDVVQRLVGVHLVLDDQGALDDELRRMCSEQVTCALGDLRDLLSSQASAGAALSERLVDLAAQGVAISGDDPDVLQLDGACEGVVRAVLDEAVRNARKHAAPTLIEVELRRRGALASLTVVNDGVGQAAVTGGTGLGLRLAVAEAAQLGGLVQHGPDKTGRWVLRLILPLEEESDAADDSQRPVGAPVG